MIVLDLNKGMVLDLTKTNDLKKVEVGVNWGMIQKKSSSFLGSLFGYPSKESISVDLDLSLILMKDNVVNKTVYYGHRYEPGIQLSEDDRSGDSTKNNDDNETLLIEFSKIDPEINKMAIVLVSFSGIPFDDIPYAEAKVYNVSSVKEQMSVTNLVLDDTYKGKKSMIFGFFEKNDNGWIYRAVCESTQYNSLTLLSKSLEKGI